MNLLDYIRFRLDPEIGKLFYVPNSDRLEGLCWSKQEMYHEQFMNDTHVFFAFTRDEMGEIVYAKVYGRKVDDSIRVRNMPIWIKYTQLRQFPKGILVETPLQLEDPDYIIRRLKAELVNVAFQLQIDILNQGTEAATEVEEADFNGIYDAFMKQAQ